MEHLRSKEDIVCLVLELRPDILGKYISGLANASGGYVLIGVESYRRELCVRGLANFNLEPVMKSVLVNLSNASIVKYGDVFIDGKRVFVIKVKQSSTLVSVKSKCYRYDGFCVYELK